MPKMNLKQFKGKLQEPFKPTNKSKGLLRAPDDESRGQEIVEKLNLLLEHYGLEVGADDQSNLLTSYMALSFFLARDAGIKGFQEETRRGRKTKWSDECRGYLVAEMVRIQGKKGVSVQSAAQILSTKEPWKLFVESKENDNSVSPDPVEVLRQIYIQSRDSAHSLFLSHRMEQLVENGKETEWIIEVASAVRK
jgi:hypothetical protein